MAAGGSFYYFVGGRHSLDEQAEALGRLMLALHDHAVVRHEVLRVARPMLGAVAAGGSFPFFVGDRHSHDELDVKALL
jgi:hypothetical protein